MAEDAKFDKTLITDLSRQARQPATITSVDASNCYDRVNHIIMSLVWLALLGFVGFPPIYAILCCLQHMKFYQRTGSETLKPSLEGSKLSSKVLGREIERLLLRGYNLALFWLISTKTKDMARRLRTQ